MRDTVVCIDRDKERESGVNTDIYISKMQHKITCENIKEIVMIHECKNQWFQAQLLHLHSALCLYLGEVQLPTPPKNRNAQM